MRECDWQLIKDANAIPPKEGRKVACKKLELALFNLGNDRYLAVDNRCPHKSGPLSDGVISGQSVFCPLHNWKIDLESGCVLSGGQGQIKKYPVKVTEGQVFVGFEKGEF